MAVFPNVRRVNVTVRVDFEAAVSSLLWGTFSANSGQSCTAGSRLFVHEDIPAELIDRVAAAAEELILGPAMNDLDGRWSRPSSTSGS